MYEPYHAFVPHKLVLNVGYIEYLKGEVRFDPAGRRLFNCHSPTHYHVMPPQLLAH